MTRIRPAAVAVGTVLSLALTGCVGDLAKRDPAASGPQDLGQAKYAVYLSPPSTDLAAQKGPQGKVLLFDQDGSYQLVETDGMDYGLFAWNDNGLFFSDMNKDYKLDGSGPRGCSEPKNRQPECHVFDRQRFIDRGLQRRHH